MHTSMYGYYKGGVGRRLSFGKETGCDFLPYAICCAGCSLLYCCCTSTTFLCFR